MGDKCKVPDCEQDRSTRGYCQMQTSHPSGRRIEDLLEFCMAMLDRYGEEFGVLDQEAGAF